MKSCVVFMIMLLFISCGGDSNEEKPIEFKDSIKAYLNYIKPIPGKSDSIPSAVSQRGDVLIAYSDCYSCHTIDKRSKGPAFKDIAKRYPVTEGYVALLAQRIILGGSGMWGYSVMTPHADLHEEDAKTMVKFILSLKE